MKLAPWSTMALIVRSSLAGCEVNPGTIGAIRTPVLTPASFSSRTAPQPLERVCSSRFEHAPGLRVHGRNAEIHGAPGPA